MCHSSRCGTHAHRLARMRRRRALSSGGVPTVVASTTRISRGVQVVAEDAFTEPDRREDQPDLAPREHAEPDEHPVVAGAGGPERGDELPDDGDDEEDAAASPRTVSRPNA